MAWLSVHRYTLYIVVIYFEIFDMLSHCRVIGFFNEFDTRMTMHHCISWYIDNSCPCNGCCCSMLRHIRNCRFIILLLSLAYPGCRVKRVFVVLYSC